MLVGTVTCCILMSLVLLWRKSGTIVDMVDDETQTLEEGKRDPEIPMRSMITKMAELLIAEVMAHALWNCILRVGVLTTI